MERTWDRVPEPLSEAEKRELNRRLSLLDGNPERGRPWDEVEAEMLAELSSDEVDELDRRWADYLAHPEEARPWDEVRQELLREIDPPDE